MRYRWTHDIVGRQAVLDVGAAMRLASLTSCHNDPLSYRVNLLSQFHEIKIQNRELYNSFVYIILQLIMPILFILSRHSLTYPFSVTLKTSIARFRPWYTTDSGPVKLSRSQSWIRVIYDVDMANIIFICQLEKAVHYWPWHMITFTGNQLCLYTRISASRKVTAKLTELTVMFSMTTAFGEAGAVGSQSWRKTLILFGLRSRQKCLKWSLRAICTAGVLKTYKDSQNRDWHKCIMTRL